MILFRKLIEDKETLEEQIINFFKNKNRSYKDIRYSTYFDTEKNIPIHTALLIYEIDDNTFEKFYKDVTPK